MPVQTRIPSPQTSFSKMYSENTRFIRTYPSSPLKGKRGKERRRERRKKEKRGRKIDSVVCSILNKLGLLQAKFLYFTEFLNAINIVLRSMNLQAGIHIFPQTDLVTTIFIIQYLMHYRVHLRNTPPNDQTFFIEQLTLFFQSFQFYDTIFLFNY